MTFTISNKKKLLNKYLVSLGMVMFHELKAHLEFVFSFLSVNVKCSVAPIKIAYAILLSVWFR